MDQGCRAMHEGMAAAATLAAIGTTGAMLEPLPRRHVWRGSHASVDGTSKRASLKIETVLDLKCV